MSAANSNQKHPKKQKLPLTPVFQSPTILIFSSRVKFRRQYLLLFPAASALNKDFLLCSDLSSASFALSGHCTGPSLRKSYLELGLYFWGFVSVGLWLMHLYGWCSRRRLLGTETAATKEQCFQVKHWWSLKENLTTGIQTPPDIFVVSIIWRLGLGVPGWFSR